MNLRSLSVAIALSFAAVGVFAQQAPICIDPPPINGAPGDATAPAGWAVSQNSPDIIAGNGPWPGFAGYSVFDVSGISPSGGTMGLFLGQDQNPPGYVESWQTTLTGLVIGQNYQVAMYWQQGSVQEDPPTTISWSGGAFRMTIDGNPTDYTGSGTAATDTWQLVTKTFTATSTTATLEIGKAPEAGFRMVVADSGNACAAVQPPRSTAVPTAPVTMLALLGAFVSLVGGYALRRRRNGAAR